MPITRTTSPSLCGDAPARCRRNGAGGGAAAAACAAERAVSGRRAPGSGRRRARGRAATRSVSAGLDPCGAFRPAEGRVGDQRDPELVAPLDDAAAERPVVEGRERNLHRRDRSELERLVEPPPVDVRDADAPDETLVGEPGEGANGRLPRRPWIRRVDEVEVDRQPVQRGEARLAVGRDRLRAAVRHPGAARPGHPALRHDPCALPCAAAVEGAGEQLPRCRSYARAVSKTVMPASTAAATVSNAGFGRQAHAAEADPELRRVEPGHDEGCSSGTAPLQPERRTSTSEGGVISDASPPPRGRRSA